MTPLPMTVISGYLGAGKTTLINRLLAEDHGQKLLVMVNDFGAINIDADLLVSSDDDTIALTNGCVCCTMGADLFLALGDALDRRPRPDHLIVEASGVADPAQIANAAIAEPDMTYGGIVTVVDGPDHARILRDPLIGPQVRAQIRAADLIYLSKGAPPCGAADLAGLTGAPVLDAGTTPAISPLLFAGLDARAPQTTDTHPPYVSWSYQGGVSLTKPQIQQILADRPAGVFRLKGHIRQDDTTGWEVQVVGNNVSITRAASSGTRLVGIGPSDRLDRATLEGWWQVAT